MTVAAGLLSLGILFIEGLFSQPTTQGHLRAFSLGKAARMSHVYKIQKSTVYLSLCGGGGGGLGHDGEERVQSPLRRPLARLLQLLDAVSYSVLTENNACGKEIRNRYMRFLSPA